MAAQSAPSVHVGEADRWGGWSWTEPKRGEHFRRCSYCGSINPDDLAAEPVLLRVDWADPKYGWPHKLYVDIPNRTPDALVPVGANSEPRDEPGWVAAHDLTDEQRALLVEHGWGGANTYGAYLFGRQGAHHAKFYSVHLADPSLSIKVLARIEQISELRFEFTPDGRVSWGRPS